MDEDGGHRVGEGGCGAEEEKYVIYCILKQSRGGQGDKKGVVVVVKEVQWEEGKERNKGGGSRNKM